MNTIELHPLTAEQHSAKFERCKNEIEWIGEGRDDDRREYWSVCKVTVERGLVFASVEIRENGYSGMAVCEVCNSQKHEGPQDLEAFDYLTNRPVIQTKKGLRIIDEEGEAASIRDYCLALLGAVHAWASEYTSEAQS